MKPTASLQMLVCLQYTGMAISLASVAASFLFPGARDAFGYFLYVFVGFAVLFGCLELAVVCMTRQLQTQAAIVEQRTQASSKTAAKASESGQLARLFPAQAAYFKNRFFGMVVLKTVLSLLFMCQFCYSLELA